MVIIRDEIFNQVTKDIRNLLEQADLGARGSGGYTNSERLQEALSLLDKLEQSALPEISGEKEEAITDRAKEIVEELDRGYALMTNRRTGSRRARLLGTDILRRAFRK